MSKIGDFCQRGIFEFSRNMKVLLKSSPIEFFISLLSLVYAILAHLDVIVQNPFYASLLPVFFILSFVCNKLCISVKLRWIYYVSFIPFVACWFLNLEKWIFSTSYCIAVLISFLLLLSYNNIKNNIDFTQNAFDTIFKLGKSLLISGIAWILVMLIYSSVVYIFDFNKNSDFIVYLCLFCFVFCWPMLFLMMDQRNESFDLKSSGLFNILMNFLLSPALIAYSIILYLYVIQRIILWSLPKGNVAYMMFSFVIIALVCKAFQSFLRKETYKWFYNNFKLIALPIISLFWIGVFYRIGEYGLTEERVYLLACGIIMTSSVLILFFRNTAHYLYMAWIGIGLLGIFTLIPGITAYKIGIYSQESRLMNAIRELDFTYKDNLIHKTKSAISLNDTNIKAYKMLLSSFEYLFYNEGKAVTKNLYGYESIDKFKESLIPTDIQKELLNDCSSSHYTTLINPMKSFEITDYNYMTEYIDIDSTLLILDRDSSIIKEFTLDEILDTQLRKVNLTRESPNLSILSDDKDFYILKEDSFIVIINKSYLELSSDNKWSMNRLDATILTK